MVRKILLPNNKLITYTLRRARRSRMLRVTVRCGGTVTATVPYSVSRNRIEEFLRSRSAWLMEKIRELELCQAHNHQQSLPADAQQRSDVLAVVRKKVEQFNAHYHFPYNTVRVKNQQSIWGSCSCAGNLSYNYKLSFLSESLFDYVIVHELCHLQELNHSAAFWKLVAETVPNYRLLRRELKQTSIHTVAP